MLEISPCTHPHPHPHPHPYPCHFHGSSRAGTERLDFDQDLQLCTWEEWILVVADVSTSLMGVAHLPLIRSTLTKVVTSSFPPSAFSQVAGEFKYHPECFACMSCKVIIEDGDAYALVQHATLYW